MVGPRRGLPPLPRPTIQPSRYSLSPGGGEAIGTSQSATFITNVEPLVVPPGVGGGATRAARVTGR